MKQRWKRPAALCLAAVMLFGLNGLPVVAATPETAAPATAETAAPAGEATLERDAFSRINMFSLMRSTPKSVGSFLVSGGEYGTDYTYGNGVLTINSGDLTVAMEEGAAACSDRIAVAGGYIGTLTLDNVNIDQSKAGGCAFSLGSGANVTLNLTGVNTLKSGGQNAGVYVPAGATLTIAGDGDLTAQGSGGTSYGGAGIGGSGNNSNVSFGSLIFAGTGTVTGNGGRGAGIGSGGWQSGNATVTGSILIRSGTVTGNGGTWGAGIGTAADGGTNQVTVTIDGGMVTGNGNSYAAGIGSGLNGNGPAITITGGIVTARGNNGAGIGSGGGRYSSDGGSVTITGGTITASGTPAVGASETPAKVSISGGTITTTGGIVAGSGSIGIAGGSISCTESALTVGGTGDALDIQDFGVLVPNAGGLTVGGTITVADGEKLTVPKEYPVTITGTIAVESGGTLEVPENATVTNNGLIQVAPGGTLNNSGTVQGSGALESQGTVNNTGSLTCKVAVKNFNIGNAVDGDYTYEDGVLTIHSGDLVLQNKNGLDTVTDRIVVDGTYSGTLTLEGVNIDRSGEGDCAFALQPGASVTLNLSGSNSLTSGGTEAGLYVPVGASLTVTGSGDLTARGSGLSDGGAGIGGNADTVTFGTIILQGTGTVSANGGNRAAGIGSGGRMHSNVVVEGTIRMESGTVRAVSGQDAAAIGCGPDLTCRALVEITGGNVQATGGVSGAGIGSGTNSSNEGTVRISGGNVNATGGSDGAGIGGSWSAGAGIVEITGGTVNATGGSGMAAGIGGYGASGGQAIISGGTVTARGSVEDINCAFSTGTNGQAVVIANTIADISRQDEWSCLLVGDSTAVWYGTNNHITCDTELTLTGDTLTIPAGSSLTAKRVTLQSGAALNVEGALAVRNLMSQGTLTVAKGGDLQVTQEFSLWEGAFENAGSTTLSGITAELRCHTTNSGTLLIKNHVMLDLYDQTFTNTETGLVEVDGGMLNVMTRPDDDSGLVNDGLFVSTNGGRFMQTAGNYECRIFFDGNGGTPAVSDLITENKVLTGLPAASRPGYTFDGWYTAPDGGSQVTAAYAFQVGATVYAHWTEAPATPTPAPSAAPASTPDPAQHTLRFVTNGGFPVDPVTIGRGAIVELWPYNPTRSGYLFAGWYADEALTQPVSTVLMNGDKTVYAAWKADPTAAAVQETTGRTGGTGGQATAAPEVTPAPTPDSTPVPTVSPASTRTPEAATPAPETEAPAPAKQGGLPLWPFLAGGAVIVAGLAIVLLRRRN